MGEPLSPTELMKELRYDSLGEAEKLTGLSYQSDELTGLLGLRLHIQQIEKKERLLDDAEDCHFGTTMLEYVTLIESLGFEEVYRFLFEGSSDEGTDTLYIFWHPKGLLLKVESYGESVNAASCYFNLNGLREDAWLHGCSGSMVRSDPRRIWCGDFDAREAFKTQLQCLELNGEFLPQWVERPFLWLLTYMDTKVEGYDYKAINQDRINKLPDYVRTAITPAAQT